MSMERVLPPVVKASLVGRHQELAVLRERFMRAASGQASVVVVVGEPGIGKTRLLEEAAVQAEHEGAIVLRGGASDIEGMPPYLPFLEALGSHIRTAPLDQLRAQAGSDAVTLNSLFPDLATRLGELPAGYPLPPEQARLRLYEAVGTFLASIADPHPVVLMLDDLQWADPASLDLLCYVAWHQPAARLLILGAYRAGEASANPTLGRALHRLTRYRLLTSLSLSPLSAEDIGSLAGSYLGGSIDPAVNRLLYTHSEGNPFFAEELLRGWLETGGLARKEGTWILAPSLDPARIPPGILGAIHQRLAQLPNEIVGQLQTAATIGRTFDRSLLAAAENVPADTVAERLERAVRAGLVRADRNEVFTFSHDKIRECLYADVPPGRRQRLHDAIGRALEARGLGESGHHLAALAFHFARGGDRGRGITYSLRAAEEALNNYAASEAMGHYRAVLDLSTPDDSRRGEFLLAMGKAAFQAEALHDAARAYEGAKMWALQAGDRTIAVRAARGMANVQAQRDEWSACRETLQAAVALLGDDRGPEAVRVLADLADRELYMGKFAEGTTHARQAFEYSRGLGDALLEARAGRSLGRLLTRVNDNAAGIPVLERALARATAANDPSEAAKVCYRIEYATMNTGELRRCRNVCLTRMEFARQSHDPSELRHAQAWLAYVAALQGCWPEVQDLIAQLRPVVERLPNSEPLTFLLKAGGFNAYQRGDYPEAEREFLALEEIFQRTPEVLGGYRGLLGLAQLAVGKRRDAQAYVTDHEKILAELPAGTTPTAPILTCLAMMALEGSDHPQAFGYYERLLPFQGQYYWFLVDRILATIETLQGNWPAAEGHLAAAEALARREDIRPEVPLVLVARADLEVARGGRGSAMRARTLLGQALNLFHELGMTAEASRARERLRGLPRQPGDDHPDYPAGLSAREVQVLRLVTAGMTNRQIARELALSENTVANHLTSIFNKIGADNRASATAFAVRQGLA